MNHLPYPIEIQRQRIGDKTSEMLEVLEQDKIALKV